MTQQPQPATSLNTEEIRLPRPPGFIRRALAAHPLAVDIFIVVWFIIGCLMGIGLDVVDAAFVADPATGEFVPDSPMPGYLTWPWWPFAVLRIAVISAALLFRRKYPLLALAAGVLASFGDHGIQALATGIALIFLLYAVPVYRSARAGWAGYGIVMLGTVLQYWITPNPNSASGSLVVAMGPSHKSMGEFITLMLISAAWMLAVLLAGINIGNRRRYVDAILDRAHQLAREREQLAQLAVAEERSRIAREMHDIVAHSVSVMIALSEGASRAVTASPEAAANAMQRSAETGRTALAEMRRLLGAITPDSGQAELAPTPGLSDLPGLIRDFNDAGLRVTLVTEGAETGDRGQGLAIYRVVQESLTNVLRYAGTGAQVEVRISHSPNLAQVAVRDFGSVGAQPPVTGLGSGRGLQGLRERARMFGGTLDAGPVPDGRGWLVRAEIRADSGAKNAN
ncbi:two-component sensor histidine kinase [Leucobacter sp. cx-42]|uniref:sensor histidine kinase n=1 Tax=unclassified Leucobacter TaxID=2621730 RepID=UPI00165D4542|nr:two-component sensor histidine kinase [Leucobacter sp. cx-42]